MTTMNACYDLTIGPPQYDCLAFLLYMESCRLGMREKHDSINLTVAPRSVVKQQHWLNNICIPMCRMLPSVQNLEVLDHMPEADMWGKNYPIDGRNARYYGLDRLVDGMAGAGRCLRPNVEFPRNDNLVTITLREASHWPTRNSKVEEWKKAATKIMVHGYDVVFVRDTEKAEEKLDPFPINPGASVDLEHRAALYRSAFCNMFISNGPAHFAMALDAPVIVLRPTNDELGSCYSRDYMRDRGLIDQFPDCPSYQRIVWEDDTCTNIVRGFEEWLKSQPSAVIPPLKLPNLSNSGPSFSAASPATRSSNTSPMAGKPSFT